MNNDSIAHEIANENQHSNGLIEGKNAELIRFDKAKNRTGGGVGIAAVF